jgi:hypothetical protein
MDAFVITAQVACNYHIFQGTYSHEKACFDTAFLHFFLDFLKQVFPFEDTRKENSANSASYQLTQPHFQVYFICPSA